MQIIIYVLDADASKKKRLKFFNFICFFNQNLILFGISNEKKLYSILRGCTLNYFCMLNDKNWTFHGSCDRAVMKTRGEKQTKGKKLIN